MSECGGCKCEVAYVGGGKVFRENGKSLEVEDKDVFVTS